MPRFIETEPKTCEQCGATMRRLAQYPMRKWATRRWCSKACMDLSRRPPPQTCRHCGGEFAIKSRRKRGVPFCSIMCANLSRGAARYRMTTVNGVKRTLHRVVAEQMIGRALLPNEIVHHKDGNRLNNTPENLEVMTTSEHSRMHMLGNQNARRS